MKECLLSEVATIDSGAGFPIVDQGSQDEAFPFLKVSDMNLAGNERLIQRWNHSVSEDVRAKLRAKAFPSGALIFPKIGAAIATNKKRQLTRPSCVDNNVMAAIPKADQLDSDYLYFLFQTKNLSDFASDSNPPSIRKSDVERWLVKIPPLPEQRRIVDLLSRAEGIVRLRREAEKKATELIPALFLNMFGDPARNPKGWANTTFGAFGECRLGKMLDKQKQSGTYQRPYLRNVNVQWDRVDTYDLLTMDFRPEEQSKFLVRSGDVLICEGGEIGRAAIWQGQIAECFYQKALHKLTPDLSIVRPDFVVWLLRHLANTGALLGSSTHATIAHLTGVQLKGLRVICPPIELQAEFEKRVDACHAIQSQQSTATAKAQAAFDALLAQTFSE